MDITKEIVLGAGYKIHRMISRYDSILDTKTVEFINIFDKFRRREAQKIYDSLTEIFGVRVRWYSNGSSINGSSDQEIEIYVKNRGELNKYMPKIKDAFYRFENLYSFEDANITLSVEEEYVDIGPMTPWDNKYIRPISIPNQIKITISMQKIYSSIIYYSRNFYRWW